MLNLKSLKGNAKAIFALLILISAFAVLFLWNIPFSHKIDTTVKALMINGKDKSEVEVDVKISGEYTRKLFRKDRFKGNLVIGGFDLTENSRYTVDMAVEPSKPIHLCYFAYNGSQQETRLFGEIFTDRKFKKFVILPYQEYLDNPLYAGNSYSFDYEGKSTTAICYPVKNRENAVKIVNARTEYWYNNFHMD